MEQLNLYHAIGIKGSINEKELIGAMGSVNNLAKACLCRDWLLRGFRLLSEPMENQHCCPFAQMQECKMNKLFCRRNREVSQY